MYDVVIVGSGIAGMTSAIYLARNNYNFKCDKAKLWIHLYLDNLDICVIRYIDSSDIFKTKGRRFTDENTLFSVEDLLKGE